ncbi:MAG: class I tRNA ligase family protein [Candidatus Adlerbacteria bacterium]|nr:class I tRNA ligase family protein [Candidatus Adlerbacteria bacterium]
MEQYDHKKIEQKWQQRWHESEAFRADNSSSKEKIYILDMFPYPSGSGLHVGHVEGYTATDIYSRYKRAQGYNVLHPMGWDAFGLPAENYAIKTGIPPVQTTASSIDTFRGQIKRLGLSYDWSREIGTHTPEYYKWTQWFFLFLYNNGLAEKRVAKVNWCPKDQTVLANEQTVSESGEKGVCVRCGTKVVQKDLAQWFFKITDFADALVDDLDQVDWPESTKINQRNWIGRSEGAEVSFKVVFDKPDTKEGLIPVFTTRPDTLFGVTYMVLAPEHAWITLAIDDNHDVLVNKEEVKAYVVAAKNKTDLDRQIDDAKEKTGVKLEGVWAINPATKEKIPMYVADYVLGGYGTGAVMGVPAHDERDFAFAKKFNVPVKQVVAPYVVITGVDAPQSEENIIKFDAESAIIKHWEKDLYYVVEFANTGHHGFVGGHVEEGEKPGETAVREATEESGYKNIKKSTQLFEYGYSRGYKVRKSREELCRDRIYIVELADRERTDIVDKETKQGSWKTADEILKDPVLINHHKLYFEHYIQNAQFTGDGVLVNSGTFDGMPNEEAKKKIIEFVGGKVTKTYKLRDWLISRQRYWGAPIPVVYDPEGKPHAVPEEHLPWILPTDVEFKPTGVSPLGQSKELLERTEKIFGKGWTPEIDTMDTFVCSSWYFFRFADPHNENEFASPEAIKKWLPVDLYMGGAEHTVLHLMYARFFTKALQKFGLISFSEPFLKLRHQGTILAEDGTKMSKSVGNVINPDEFIELYGADTVRLYEMFMGPLEAMKPWNTKSIIGVRRFLERVWKLGEKVADIAPDLATETLRNQTIKKVSEDLDVLKMNTAVSALMVFSNHLAGLEQVPRPAYVTLLQLLAPLAPHITYELAEVVGLEHSEWSVWPTADETKLVSHTVSIAVQVNGKLRGSLTDVPSGVSEDEALTLARTNPAVALWLAKGKEVKAIYVPNKIINFVVL